jgi:hypothetical protein
MPDLQTAYGKQILDNGAHQSGARIKSSITVLRFITIHHNTRKG